MNTQEQTDNWNPTFSKWRHGGWYITNLRYPNGGMGCVSNNYDDKKWRIVCDPRKFEDQPTYKTRNAAARAERALIEKEKAEVA